MTVDALEVTKLNNMCPVSNEVALGTLLSGLAPAELAFLDGVTAGTVTASKAAVVDANKDIGDFRNLDAVNLDAGVSGTAGTLDVFPTTAAKGKLIVSATDNTGDTTVTLKNAAHGQASVYSLRDSGAATGIIPTGTAGGAYTQTYATAERTHANLTATAIAAAVPAAAPAGGTGATEGAYDTAVNRNAAITTINGLVTWATEMDLDYEAILVDLTDLKQLVNAVIDDLQAFGISG